MPDGLCFYNAVEERLYVVDLVWCSLPGGTTGYRLEATHIYDGPNEDPEKEVELDNAIDMGTLVAANDKARVIDW